MLAHDDFVDQDVIMQPASFPVPVVCFREVWIVRHAVVEFSSANAKQFYCFLLRDDSAWPHCLSLQDDAEKEPLGPLPERSMKVK